MVFYFYVASFCNNIHLLLRRTLVRLVLCLAVQFIPLIKNQSVIFTD